MLRSASFSADNAVTEVLTFCWSSMRRVAVTVTTSSSRTSPSAVAVFAGVADFTGAAGVAGAVCAKAAPAQAKPRLPNASATAKASGFKVGAESREAEVVLIIKALQRQIYGLIQFGCICKQF